MHKCLLTVAMYKQLTECILYYGATGSLGKDR